MPITKSNAAKLGKKGGSVRSPRKAKAAKENAKMPRKRKNAFEEEVSAQFKRATGLEFGMPQCKSRRAGPKFNGHPLIGLDDHFNFGRPFLISSKVDTRAIALRCEMGETTVMISDDYGIPVAHIRAALAFEQSLQRNSRNGVPK